MRLPRIVLPVGTTVTCSMRMPSVPLLAITLPLAGVSPPTVLPGDWSLMPSARFGIGNVPAALRPTMFPWIVLPFESSET